MALVDLNGVQAAQRVLRRTDLRTMPLLLPFAPP
jgi:hypothetical protein